MHWVQLTIIVAYFVLLAMIGKIARRFVKSSSDFLIAGRNLGVVLVTVSIAGEWLGGMSTIGTSEKAYQMGFFPLWYNVSTAAGMFLFGLTLAAVYRKHNVHTVGEMLEKCFNREVRIVASLAFVVGFVILACLQLQAIGGLFSQLFGGILGQVSASIQQSLGVSSALFEPYNMAVIIAGVFVIFYVYEGGMASIALTNLMHVILLFATIITVFVLVLCHVGGFGGLFETLQNQFLAEGGSAEDASRLVASYKNPLSSGLGKVFAWLLGGILAGFASQASIQPVFAAKDIRTARRSAIFSAILIAPLGILVATMGIAVRSGAFGYLPPEKAKEALPFLLMNQDFLPPWLSGLAAAGILAAILSTVAPVMFAVSTILVKDFYHLIIHKDATDEKLLKTSRLMMVVVGLAVIPLAIFIKGGMLEAAYITYGIRGAAAIVVLLGIYLVSKKTRKTIITPRAAGAAIVVATSGIILYVLLKEQLGFKIDKVYIALTLSVLTVFVVTVLTKKHSRKA